jgi:adenylate cyclase class 2
MTIEIEKKYRLTPEQRDEVQLALEEIDAAYNGEDNEENTIYGGGILDEQKSVIRLRKTSDKTILTYKRRIINDMPVKQQIEHESRVDNAAEIEAILESLGYEPRIIYEKRRRTWTFRTVEIVLDELPFGLYMEIEGPMMAIAEAEMYLDIEHLEVEEATYPWLTKTFGKSNGTVIEARF